jgi:threonyl-tRNA synthetase
LDPYAQEIQKKFWDAGFQVDCDLDAGTTLNKKIRQNQLSQYNFIGGKIFLLVIIEIIIISRFLFI